MNEAEWTIVETIDDGFNPTQIHHKETVFTLSNGYLGTRGSFEEGYPGAQPATLINGVYDAVAIAGTELANCPDWLSLSITVEGERFRLDQGTVLSYRRWLNLYRGTLSRQVTWCSPHGHTLELRFERFVSLEDEHVLALRCQIRSLDFTGTIEVHSSLNGYPDNEGVLHWDCLNQGGSGNTIWLHERTRHSKIELGMAARLTVMDGEHQRVSAIGFHNYPTLVTHLSLHPHQEVTLEKVVAIFTSRETSQPEQVALAKVRALPDYPVLLATHEAAWARFWQTSDVVIEGDLTAQLAIRYNLFQLLSAAPRHDDRVSIPAKTLSGFAYRGHVFWDTEIFLLPCLTLTHPTLARNLLTYRYHALAGARRKAKAAGYEGAMYAWESADTGDEVTPTWVPRHDSKDLVRIWCGELEVHISTDVAYAAWHYWQATGDQDWMQRCGAEMILDTAVFWGSRVTWNPTHQRYDILDVIGPDEYHERVDNNVFTNCMTQWHLQTALEVLDWLRQTNPDRAAQLTTQLNLIPERLNHWQHIIDNLYLPHDPNTGLMEQFEGFFGLGDIDLASYEPRSRSMQVILGIEGANQRQVLKQADVIMLLYLLRRGMFADRPDPYYDRATLQANWDYYVPRTDHTYGSSLGPPVHAIMACELGKPEEAYEHFLRSALVDLSDVRGNAREGIHAASTGGVWQSVVFGFAGVHLTPEGPVALPNLPPHWSRLKFRLVWQGKPYEFDLQAPVVRPEQPTQPSTLLPISGVIFDLDGVLTDTSEFHYLAWKQLADEVGIPFDRTINEALRGVSRRDSLLHILNGRTVSDEDFQEMMDRKNRYYLALIETISPEHLLPGVSKLLRELHAAGVRVAIGSSSKNAKDVVQRLGIAHQIDAIADGHSVTCSKPAPDVFLYAAVQLGLNPINCVVVEDAASGIEAALSAGMWAVGLGPKERVGAAHVVLPNLVDAHWRGLLTSLTCQVTGLCWSEVPAYSEQL